MASAKAFALFLALNLLMLGTARAGSCPRDALQLAACANVLGGLVGVAVGAPPVLPCCSLVAGLLDAEAAACLCTVIRGYVLGVRLNLPIDLTILLNNCGRRGAFACD